MHDVPIWLDGLLDGEEGYPGKMLLLQDCQCVDLLRSDLMWGEFDLEREGYEDGLQGIQCPQGSYKHLLGSW
jgi:hypothetical protein